MTIEFSGNSRASAAPAVNGLSGPVGFAGRSIAAGATARGAPIASASASSAAGTSSVGSASTSTRHPSGTRLLGIFG